MTTTLRRGDGSTYLTLQYIQDGDWIHARWFGRQTLGSVMDGGLTYLELIRRQPCPRLLNDHRDLVGTFTEANEWIQQIWTPLTIAEGLRSIGQVVSPDIFGHLSIEDLQHRIGDKLDIYLFEEFDAALAWLLTQ
ncbi:MAG TPA: hypothetical protein VF629_11080 [Hymenobacter sp.]|jgi:hypothetical protein|uniref:hypothetical protein n=1 Tax=Hymenobacter sp. TaxID=1898978 RepID=UPI002ED7E014